jgi:hypothetical protein
MNKGVVGVSGKPQVAAGLVDYAMDLVMIQRNVRDLAKTASYLHLGDLEELHQLAYKNLKSKMDGGVLAEDPNLCMEVYKLISTLEIQTLEAKRKAADTLIKARCLIDPSLSTASVMFDGEEEDPLDGFVEEGVVIQEAGVFAGVSDVDGADYEVDEAEDSNSDLAG